MHVITSTTTCSRTVSTVTSYTDNKLQCRHSLAHQIGPLIQLWKTQLVSASEFNSWVFAVWQQPKGQVQLSALHWPLECFWHQKLLCYSDLDVLAHLHPPLENTRLNKKNKNMSKTVKTDWNLHATEFAKCQQRVRDDNKVTLRSKKDKRRQEEQSVSSDYYTEA